MGSRMRRATLVVLAFCAPRGVAAQTLTIETSVTFLVPVNLTQLSPDLEKVRAFCGVVSSPAMTPTMPLNAPPPIVMAEALVVSGQVITTLRSEFLILSGWLQNAVGQPAAYACELQGYSKSLARWSTFSDNAADAVFRLKPTPPAIQGTFVW